MFEAPLGYAFLAGVFALANPCGFAMLPAYVGYQLGQGTEAPSPVAALARGTLLGLVATLGFLFIFGLIGAVIALGGRWVIKAMPIAGLAVGVLVVLVALWLLLTKRHLGLLVASRIEWGKGKGLAGTFVFGLAYGLASLGCALPVFLVVVVSSLAVGGFASALGSFVSYAMGMGTALLAVSWGVALSKEGSRTLLRRFMPVVEVLGNVLLLLSGSYLVYYWTLGTGGKQFLFG